MKSRLLAAAIVATALFHPTLHAATHDERVDGDLSDNHLAPLALTLSTGSNVLYGQTGGSDRDYFALTVPAGSVLEAIIALPDTLSLGGASFVGVQAGAVMSVPPTTGTAAELLGWRHYSSFSDLGQDILDDMGRGFGAIGFTAPLGSGTYTFWIQEFNSGVGVFDFDFRVSAVPEPNTALTMAASLVLLGAAVARRRG